MAAAARVAFLLGLVACGLELELPPNSSAPPRPRIATEWPAYGGDPGGLRYAPLEEIRPGNVAKLELAWAYRHGDVREKGDPLGVTSFQATPILVDGVLYFPTPLNRVIALDPATDSEHWSFDPGLDPSGRYAYLIARGVAAWKDEAAGPGAPCARRILTATRDAYLFGRPSASRPGTAGAAACSSRRCATRASTRRSAPSGPCCCPPRPGASTGAASRSTPSGSSSS